MSLLRCRSTRYLDVAGRPKGSTGAPVVGGAAGALPGSVLDRVITTFEPLTVTGCPGTAKPKPIPDREA
jgi:hypothetical protein